MLAAAAFVAASGCAHAQGGAAPATERAPVRPHCFSTAQTRIEIEARRLIDPLSSMRDSALRAQGEPLGARLCQHGEAFIYEIKLLRPDGRIVKVMVDAASGRPHSGQMEK
jgi:hypothetical protein